MTILCRTCHTRVEKLCIGFTHNCKDFERRMKDEGQALKDEQDRIYNMQEESRKKMLKEKRYYSSRDIPDNLRDKYVSVENILRVAKMENLSMYEYLLGYFEVVPNQLITKE